MPHKFLSAQIFAFANEQLLLSNVLNGETEKAELITKTFDTMQQVVFYKRIHKVFFTDSIPKSPSGKILRKDLRARLAAGVPSDDTAPRS